MHIHIHHAHAHAQEQQQKVEQTIPVAEKELGISVLAMCILLERIGNGKNGIISEKYVQNVSIDFEIMFAIQFFKKNP
jgi:hypothetical protein